MAALAWAAPPPLPSEPPRADKQTIHRAGIPSKAMLNNSHIYHQTVHDTKARGIDGKLKLAASSGARSAVVLT